MSITKPSAGDELSAATVGQIIDGVTPTFWRGVLAATESHVSGRYLSLTLTTDGTAEVLTVTAATDAIKVNKAGVYRVTAKAAFPDNTANNRYAYLYLNPTADSYDTSSAPTVGATLLSQEMAALGGVKDVLNLGTRLVRLATTDKLMVVLRQDSGSTLTIPTDNAQTFIELEWVGE